MSRGRRTRSSRGWLVAIALVAAAAAVWGLLEEPGLKAQPPGAGPDSSSSVFTPAHRSVGEAARHFFGVRPEPVQPIPFPHKTHIANEVGCDVCHPGAARGPAAGLPTLHTCMLCHESTATGSELIVKITAQYEKGVDLAWQRVYGWNEEAHVRFKHAPHIRAQVACATCHGDLSTMTVAERAVEHTMGFCVDCHKERKASNDCLTCHY